MQDDAKLKIAVKGRQTGFSFAAALRAVLWCLERKRTHILLSKGERQSKLLMEKVRDHLKVRGMVTKFSETKIMEHTSSTQLEARFANGSVIYALPANPDTARGYTGDVTLDEFAFHADSRKIFTALYPTITRGHTLEVISTPNGRQGKFFDLARQAGLVPDLAARPDSPWSAHRVSIHDAASEGLKVDLHLLRDGCEDEETWQQEYECVFLSDSENYIPMEMITACQSEAATLDVTPDWRPSSNLYMGIDIGRKRDLTVAWLMERVGDVFWTRAVTTLRNQPFEVQERMIRDLMDRGVRRAAVDKSGLGMMLAERLAAKYGSRVEPVGFTAPFKEHLAPRVKALFEQRRLRIPDHRAVRADLNAVKRLVTSAGNIRFDADRTERGHADRFWALALAQHAAEGSVPSVKRVSAGAQLASGALKGW